MTIEERLDQLEKRNKHLTAALTLMNEIFEKHVGRRFYEAKSQASSNDFIPIKDVGDQSIIMGNLGEEQVLQIVEEWRRNWNSIAEPWRHFTMQAPTWRCGGSLHKIEITDDDRSDRTHRQ